MPGQTVLQSIYKTLGQLENRKGFSAEEKGLEALLLHYRKEPWIKFPRKATKEEDIHLGIDLVVETNDMGKLFIQVKSSGLAKKRFCEKRRRSMIVVVIIKPKDDLDLIWQKIRQALFELRAKILLRRGV